MRNIGMYLNMYFNMYFNKRFLSFLLDISVFLLGVLLGTIFKVSQNITLHEVESFIMPIVPFLFLLFVIKAISCFKECLKELKQENTQ